MLKSKNKEIYLEVNDDALLLAVAQASEEGCIVESIERIPSNDQAALIQALKTATRTKENTYFQAVCSVYPKERLLRRTGIDLKRLRDGGQIAQALKEDLEIDPGQYSLCLLSPKDGRDLDPTSDTDREVLLCGAPTAAINQVQEHLLGLEVYPTRLEIGTVAHLGALCEYLRAAKIEEPALVLEVDQNLTGAYIVSAQGVELSRLIHFGVESMIPIVQKELSLKDEDSTRRLFFSGSFDFSGMGPVLLRRLFRDLQSSLGFHEVQTGQSVVHFFCTRIPGGLGWFQPVVAEGLGLKLLKPDYNLWLQTARIQFADPTMAQSVDANSQGLLALMGRYDHGTHEKN
ncbi:MAG: hypothetical protein EA425_14695 [Puniceicoccaceae bacterium]|nr:MAG: hypothetical protein EA425_14695 [Puniceicoccaceae bacterium]